MVKGFVDKTQIKIDEKFHKLSCFEATNRNSDLCGSSEEPIWSFKGDPTKPVPLGHISNIIMAIGIIGNIGKTALIGHQSMGCQQFIYT